MPGFLACLVMKRLNGFSMDEDTKARFFGLPVKEFMKN
jgi:hypothetical protein